MEENTIINPSALSACETTSASSSNSQFPAEEKIITKMCLGCGSAVKMYWDAATMGFSAFCPHCGEVLRFCEECRRSDPFCTCSCDEEEACCKHSKVDRQAPAAMTVWTPVGSIIVRAGVGDGRGLFIDLRRQDANQDMSLVYIGFSPESKSGIDCIEALIDGEGKKDQKSERVFLTQSKIIFAWRIKKRINFNS